ncbi:MAG TPA: DUF2007 domain-containing protein [Actinomycetota bacterium]|nr:DUF2007 domain-containing protein [Actinomycetota bacterium]
MDPYEGRYRYCPRCRCEYRPGFDLCTDCGVDLVDELPPEGAQGPPDADLEALQSWVGTDPVAVLVTPSEINAHVARGLLVDAAIPCSVWGSGHDGYFGHVVQMAPFPFRVMVHKDDEAEARELLASRFEGSPGE